MAVAIIGTAMSFWYPTRAEDCASAYTQLEMNDCAKANLDQAEGDLKDIYEKLMSRASPKGQQKLRAAEKAWLEYRKKQCDFDSFGIRDGSAYTMVLLYCLAAATNQHIEHLKSQMNCEQGVLGCGGQ